MTVIRRDVRLRVKRSARVVRRDRTRASPLLLAPQGVDVSAVVIVTGLNFTADQVYPMTLEGTLGNGQTFDYTVQIQVADVP